MVELKEGKAQTYFGRLFSYRNLVPRRGCFSITPRWSETASTGTGLRGDRPMRHSLVGDHAAVLPDVCPDMIEDQGA